MKKIPDKDILLFKSCLVSVEYPGVESSTAFLFDKLGVGYHRDQRQSCCTGLGHYYDLFDQLSTTALAARNFWVARDSGNPNIAVMCATCYAILKKSAEILNENDEAREKINELLEDADLGKMAYHKGDIDPHKNIFHAAEILYNQREIFEESSQLDFSQFNIATHHACHYCKVHYEDTIGGVRHPMLIDEIVNSCGVDTVGWYDQKRLTCGAGFRQRFTNNELSLKVTAEKLLSLKENQTDIMLHMCPNCQMQFDRYQPVIEKKLDVKFNIFHLNISQFLALNMGADPYKVVGVQTHTVPLKPLLKKLGIESVESSVESEKMKMDH
ncbi:ferredoxin:CoB-CoM heterodisulfide reductase subunit HdrB [Methanobacterium formicicum]|uniref:ferredoxin:CoB-CoM heterodisulfide reductase subunit HdrB n=1 Tax=Methanobacterium formicicum TaxID=2162 RepID=UPI0024928BC7|nr:ferredoxin:CoB-CoM heterodisulfide reductase subunit HdrB [Methanobacterium formicicum]